MSISTFAKKITQPYNTQGYWEERYLLQQYPFDWLEDFNSLKPYLTEVFNSFGKEIPSLTILNSGCGMSEISENIYTTFGIKSITNIDYSVNAIRYMYQRTRNYPEMNWIVMNSKEMKFEKETFDVIIDKCLSDSIYCGDHPLTEIAFYYKEVYRVLKKGGIFLMVSYGEPKARMENLEKPYMLFDIKMIKLEENIEEENGHVLSKTNYVYICKKDPNQEFDEVLYNTMLEELKEKEERIEETIKPINDQKIEIQEIKNIDDIDIK